MEFFRERGYRLAQRALANGAFLTPLSSGPITQAFTKGLQRTSVITTRAMIPRARKIESVSLRVRRHDAHTVKRPSD
jgi:hypothetical protein